MRRIQLRPPSLLAGALPAGSAHLSALHGRASTVDQLLEAGAEAAPRLADGSTPFTWPAPRDTWIP